MKVLIVHNFYQSFSPSGEDIVFQSEKKLLKNAGIEVVTFEKHNDEIVKFTLHRKINLSFDLIWSFKTYKELQNLIIKEKPDIVHFHNLFYLISPSAYYVCKKFGIRVVQTLHNFRFFCVNGLLMRNSRICEDCVGKIPWRGFFYGCFRGSRAFSLPIFLMDTFHRALKTWSKKVDAYIVLTNFTKAKFIECGLPKEKIFVKPNFILNPPEANYSNKGYVLFMGRISKEKGLRILLAAVKQLQSTSMPNISLKIVGDGKDIEQSKKFIHDENIKNVEWCGNRGHGEALDILKNAAMVVMPSIWHETFSMVIIEAFACGKLVIASKTKVFMELIEDGKTGLMFDIGDVKGLSKKIEWAYENNSACMEIAKNARKEFEEKYTEKKNYEMLTGIYRKVLKTYK